MTIIIDALFLVFGGVLGMIVTALCVASKDAEKGKENGLQRESFTSGKVPGRFEDGEILSRGNRTVQSDEGTSKESKNN